MALPPRGHALQRLRERFDEREHEPKTMKIVRVEYIVALTGEDGKTELVNKERILYDLDSIVPEHIQQILEQELQATEQGPPGESIPGTALEVTNIT